MSKVIKIRNELIARGGDAIILSSQLNRRYVSGFDYTDGYILITKKSAVLYTDFRYTEAARAAAGDEFEIVQASGAMLEEINRRLTLEKTKKLLFEEKEVSFAAYGRFKEVLTAKLIPDGTNLMETLRAVKDDGEIAKIRKAQSIADAAFSHILSVMKPEMTETEVALEIEFFMRKSGAEALAFDIIAVSGKNSSLPHGTPRNRRLERGFFTLDFGAKFEGYCSDMTRTVVLGKADAEIKKVYETVLAAQSAALESIAAGVPCHSVDAAARDIINAAGFEKCFGHATGHAVGMFIHESPRLSARVDKSVLLAPGNVVTVEPGIYIAEKYGCRIEDLVAVTADGKAENLTGSPKNLIELF